MVASSLPLAPFRPVRSATTPTPSGRAVAGPIRSGEVITDVRLVGPALVAGLGDGLVASPGPGR